MALQGIIIDMKTAISVPDDVFEKAAQLASRMGKSRSGLFREALCEYLERHMQDDVTDAMNRAVDEIEDVTDSFVSSASRRVLENVEW